MFFLGANVIKQLNEKLQTARQTITELHSDLNDAAYLRGLHKGESIALRDEIKELREINRVLLDRVAGSTGFGPVFTPQVPATPDGTASVPFSQTPTEFLKMAEELERKAMREHQQKKLEELARDRASDDSPKEGVQ